MDSSFAWRLPFTILASLSMIYAVGSILWLVPSPRWLTLRGRQSEASAAWDLLGVGHAEREKAEEIEQAATVAEARNPSPTEKHSFLDVFARDVWSRTLMAIFLLGMQQLSGIDGVLYVSHRSISEKHSLPTQNLTNSAKYAPLLFAQAGLASSEASFLASGVSAIVIFGVTIPALLFSDKWGRRASAIYGGLGLSVTMFLIGGLYAGNAVHDDVGAGRWVVIVSIFVFLAIFSLTWSIGIKIYVAESQPQRTRASATNLAHGSNWVTNFLVALTTPILLAKSSFGAYFLFGGCTLLTAMVCFIFMPETKGKSLNEIEEAFRRKNTVSGSLARAIRKVLGRTSALWAN